MPIKLKKNARIVGEKRMAMKTIRDGDESEENDAFDETMMMGKTLVKPDDQLQLTDAELNEEFTRILTAYNPHAPENIVRYSFKDRCYKQIPSVDQLAIHFSLDGNIIHKDSDEAKQQMIKTGAQQAIASKLNEPEKTADLISEKTESEIQTDERDTPAPKSSANKKITNQFNFSERASQTYNNPYRERGINTEPPPRMTYSGNVTQWEIYDAYQLDFQKQEKTKEKKSLPGRKDDENKRKKLLSMDLQGDDVARLKSNAKIIERMLNQTIYDDVSQDFKYYEDPSDEFKDGEGTLLPLWRFSHDKAKKLSITSMCWNPLYTDLFAVGLGSYDFMKQSNGMILFYTIKNPSHPEYEFITESSVLCLDIHPIHSHLIACGFYDGNVAVYKQGNDPAPLYISDARNGKHTDAVWQVRWQKDDLDNNLNFYSLSSDGRVVSWTLLKNEIHCNDVIKLAMEIESEEDKDNSGVMSLGGGTTFDFHKEKDHMFICGTEEGKLFTCSKAYSSTFLDSFEAHKSAVYRVMWNYYHTSIFITCSEDWLVRIWDTSSEKKNPIFSFDLNSPVGDVAWSPFSSTSFAAVTADGKVHYFDLNINKYEAVCEQAVSSKKKSKLTHIAFNTSSHIIIVGDDKGNVTSFKLSPNLRKIPKEKKTAEIVKPEEKEAQRIQGEIAKLEKILATQGIRDTVKE